MPIVSGSGRKVNMDLLKRLAECERQSSETNIAVQINLDGSGEYNIETGIGFFDHMLTLFAVHSLCDLSIRACGDIEVDDHHTVEDTGICLGSAIKEALGDKKGITRYGEATIPMDEALVRVVIDLSGRSYMQYSVDIPAEKLGSMSSENIKEFFQALVNQSGISLHIDLLRGQNSHHIAEAVFKAFARAFKQALTPESRVQGIWSSKGML